MDAEESEVTDDFEEIHTGRRLVRRYCISQCMSISAVVLDSADPLGGEIANKCVAILVPHGRESEWMYSTEGGQWQLLAVAGVSRLIILSRIWNTLAMRPKLGVLSKSGAGDERMRAPIISESEGNSRAKGRQQPRYVDQPYCSDLTETDARRGKRTNVRENGTADGRVKRRHDHAAAKTITQKHDDEHENVGSRKVEDQQQRDALTAREVSKLRNFSEEDDALKCALQSVLITLCPRVAIEAGKSAIPFVEYTDNVVQRIVVEEVVSPLTGLMRVEDVELDPEVNEMDEHLAYSREPTEDELSQASVKQCLTSWRRRLIFQRMPNLIQTEVRLAPSATVDFIRVSSPTGEATHDIVRKHEMGNCDVDDVSGDINFAAADRQVDHSRLVHKYLPPIVTGFVLVASCLDSCLVSGLRRAKVLAIGVGGGALPIFLQKHFQFNIQVVEIDEMVLRLARDHFGLMEDAHFHATAADGLAVVEGIAATVVHQGLVSDQIKHSWTLCLRNVAAEPFSRQDDFKLSTETVRLPSVPIQGCLKEVDGVEELPLEDCCSRLSPGTRSHIREEELPGLSRGQLEVPSCSHSSPRYCNGEYIRDLRVELIILDVDVGDAQLDLSSPPLSFLEPRFLLAAKIALQEGGMLVVNVVPCKHKAYMAVIHSLKAVFAEVYEISLKEDLQHVVFALPVPMSFNFCLKNSRTVSRVRQVVGDGLIRCIRRLKPCCGNEDWPSLKF